MKNETIGIVMPAYNAAQDIAESIRSVIAQDYTDWLLFVSDDGSTDDTFNIVQEFMKNDQRIIWLAAEEGHKGVCNARRRGIAASDTKWIAFLDSDDVWRADKLSAQMELIEKNHARFVFTGSSFIDDQGNLLDYILRVPAQVGYPEILKQDIISCSSVLIDKALLGGCFEDKDEPVCEDFAAWIRILRDHKTYAAGIDAPLLQYRMRKTSRSSNKFQNAVRVLKTYKACDLSSKEMVWAWMHYIYRGAKKYRKIARARRKIAKAADL